MKLELISKKIKIFSPASVTNVGSGFDTFGFALNFPGDELTLTITDKPGIRIKKILGDSKKLPIDINKNTATVSLMAMMNELNSDFGVEIELHKKMPFCSGLGSSAASSVASVFALNKLLKKPFRKNELLKFAIEGEKIASGENVHADNVAACLYGGFIIVRSLKELDIIQIPFPPNLFVTVIHPFILVKTEDTRKILKQSIPLSKAITQWANAAGLVAGLIKKDFALIGRALEDVIVEPIRADLIPNFYEVKNVALQNGAFGCSISGSGPSIFAFSNSKSKALRIGKAMADVYSASEIKYDLYISKINKVGPKILSMK